MSAISEIINEKYQDHFVEPGFTYNFHANGEMRQAVASGIVSVSGVNLTPGVSRIAVTLYARTGSVWIQTP